MYALIMYALICLKILMFKCYVYYYVWQILNKNMINVFFVQFVVVLNSTSNINKISKICLN